VPQQQVVDYEHDRQSRAKNKQLALGPSLSTSGETLTIEESMNLEGENGAPPECWRRARMEPRLMQPPASKISEP
jgi:hypothetical protein